MWVYLLLVGFFCKYFYKMLSELYNPIFHLEETENGVKLR